MATPRFRFDPNAVAHTEVEGWKAYYDRAWLRLLRLIVKLSQAQFRIPFPQSLVAAYHITRASVAWVPKHHDAAKIETICAIFTRWRVAPPGLALMWSR